VGEVQPDSGIKTFSKTIMTTFGRFTIITQFRPVTEHNPARIYASCHLNKLHVTYSYGGPEKCHLEAAQALLEKVYNMKGAARFKLIGGFITEGQYAFVVLEK
jgi:hypothetical protein